MNDESGQSEFERRAAGLLRASAEDLNGPTGAKLAHARRAALEATGQRGWPGLRYLAPAGAMAAALLVAVLFIGSGEGPGAVNGAAPAAFYDMELFADADAWELAQEPDLEFIEWAAGIARQEGTGG